MRLGWLAGGAIALGVTLAWIDPAAITGVLRGADGFGLGVAAALLIGSHVASVVRWRAVLCGLGAPLGYAVLARWYLLGSFSNSFLPSSIGGDAVRAVAAARSLGPADAMTSVIFDRLLGYIAVLACGGVAIVATGVGADAATPLAGGAAVIAGAVAVLAWTPGRDRAVRLATRLPLQVGRPVLALLAASARVVAARRSLSIAATGALVVQLACALGFVSLARALGVPGDAWFLIAVYSVSTAVSALPLSIGGLGVREAVAGAMFLHAGLEPGLGVALSLAWFGLSTTWSGASGLLYLIVRTGGASTVPRARTSLAAATSPGHHWSS